MSHPQQPAAPPAPRGKVRWLTVLAVTALALAAFVVSGRGPGATLGAVQQATPLPDSATHTCRFVMVPMRDRVRLNTKVCEAKNAAGTIA
mgnify:CR=1 FL=1